MNNQQFIFIVFGSLTLVAFSAMGAMAIFEHKQKKKSAATAEPESRPRSAE
jgi:hypothetical protein